jgi:hypothetical protein
MQKLNTLLLAAVSAGCCTAVLAGGGLGMSTHDARVGAAASPTRDEAYAVAIQRDGKLLVAGWSTWAAAAISRLPATRSEASSIRGSVRAASS